MSANFRPAWWPIRLMMCGLAMLGFSFAIHWVCREVVRQAQSASADRIAKPTSILGD